MKHLLLPALLLALAGCDSTPRERQALAKKEIQHLDTASRQAAKTLKRVARVTARYDSANRARRAQPLSAQHEMVVCNELLGSYSGHLDELTPATIGGAYRQLLQQVRARRQAWTSRDWDYARAVYARLNAELKRVRLDLPAREEVRVRAWQAEFVSLQAGHSGAELRAALKTK